MATISQLQYIVAVANLRHFGRAALFCHISQPSLSMQIQKVEEEFGIRLFDRNQKPIAATPEGKKFIEQSKVLLREYDKLVHLAQEQFDPLSGEFRLAVIPTLAPYLLPLFLKDFATRYPKIQLHIDEMKTEDIIAGLKNDTLDGALLATPLREEMLAERPLFYEPFYLYLSADHPLTMKSKIKSEDLDFKNMWLLQDGHCIKNQIVNFCSLREDRKTFMNVRFQGGNFETLRYILQKNSGYTLFPHLFVETLSKSEVNRSVREFRSPRPTREVSLVFRKNQWKTEILKALEQTVRSSIPSVLKSKESSSMNVLPIQADK